ncbi:uncharacterized protein [Penaeus vannamei]|uniref:uncharacterized protein isoform X4 n=1 Tax=Penaeus vannamei TaxID=6689 RepID=UPI00387F5675
MGFPSPVCDHEDMKLKISVDPEAADAAPEKRASSDAPQSPFERVLDEVGGEGRYQILLLFAYLLPLSFYSPFGSSSLLLMMTTPDHSCRVPGRPSHVSEEEWRNMTIPWEDGADGKLRLSQCHMYNMTYSDALRPGPSYAIDTSAITRCQHGWDYDKSRWRETSVSFFNLVCDDASSVTTIFSLAVAGNALGTLILSILSDRPATRFLPHRPHQLQLWSPEHAGPDERTVRGSQVPHLPRFLQLLPDVLHHSRGTQFGASERADGGAVLRGWHRGRVLRDLRRLGTGTLAILWHSLSRTVHFLLPVLVVPSGIAPLAAVHGARGGVRSHHEEGRRHQRQGAAIEPEGAAGGGEGGREEDGVDERPPQAQQPQEAFGHHFNLHSHLLRRPLGHHAEPAQHGGQRTGQFPGSFGGRGSRERGRRGVSALLRTSPDLGADTDCHGRVRRPRHHGHHGSMAPRDLLWAGEGLRDGGGAGGLHADRRAVPDGAPIPLVWHHLRRRAERHGVRAGPGVRGRH